MSNFHNISCLHRTEDDSLCDPQFYPKLKQRVKTNDEKHSPKKTKQQQLPIYKCPGPAAYSLDLDSIKQNAPSFTIRTRLDYSGKCLMLDDGRISVGEADLVTWDSTKNPGHYDVRRSDFDKVRPKGTSLHGFSPLSVEASSPGPAAYFIEGNTTRKGMTPGYRKWSSYDYSTSWRTQKNKFSVCDADDNVKIQP